MTNISVSWQHDKSCSEKASRSPMHERGYGTVRSPWENKPGTAETGSLHVRFTARRNVRSNFVSLRFPPFKGNRNGVLGSFFRNGGRSGFLSTDRRSGEPAHPKRPRQTGDCAPASSLPFLLASLGSDHLLPRSALCPLLDAHPVKPRQIGILHVPMPFIHVGWEAIVGGHGLNPLFNLDF